MHKLGIIVPYRNRPKQLITFKRYIKDFLQSKINNYEIIVVEQADKQDFNRAKLLNIGFKKAEELQCDYVVFHDIDMLPVEVDYTYSDIPLHMVTELDLPEGISRTLFDEYFGGVTLFPSHIFKQINGYSNQYYGWGFEDDDLLLRCQENFVKLDSKKVIQKSKDGCALKFNGDDSYIAVPNIFNSLRDFTIFGSFEISTIKNKDGQVTDELSIFSIPGFDTTFTYNSFKNFTFQFWKYNKDSIAITSKHYPEGSYNFTVTICNKEEPKKITLYINGEEIGYSYYDKLMNIGKEKYFYLGTGNPQRETKNNFFHGLIDSFAVYGRKLSNEEILQISSNKVYSLFNFDSYKDLKLYYDAKGKKDTQVIDLSGYSNHGYAHNVGLARTSRVDSIDIPIPHRRNGKYKVLPHDENGYKEGYWVNWNSRKNQIRYYEKFYKNRSEYKSDGLTRMKYKIKRETSENNYHHIEAQL